MTHPCFSCGQPCTGEVRSLRPVRFDWCGGEPCRDTIDGVNLHTMDAMQATIRPCENGVRPVVAYLAHPVSAPDQAGVDANLVNARRWLKWLVDATEWAISAPWMPYVETLAEASYRERGLRDDLWMVDRHDLIVLVGGRVSSGMAIELARAKERGLVVLDLTRMGVSPPVKINRRDVALYELCSRAADEIERRAAGRDPRGGTK